MQPMGKGEEKRREIEGTISMIPFYPLMTHPTGWPVEPFARISSVINLLAEWLVLQCLTTLRNEGGVPVPAALAPFLVLCPVSKSFELSSIGGFKFWKLPCEGFGVRTLA